MQKPQYDWDNRKPLDKNYPTFKVSGLKETNLLVDIGQYIVSRDSNIMIATTSNNVKYSNSFLQSINEGFIRAKFIGNKDDSLECANQIRFATASEIAIAEAYDSSKQIKITNTGQVALL